MSYKFYPDHRQYKSWPNDLDDLQIGGIATGTSTAFGTLGGIGKLAGTSNGVSTGSGTLTAA